MPVKQVTVDLTAGTPVQIVRIGERINGLSVLRSPRGVFFGVRFGNNPLVNGYSGTPTWTFGPDTARQDVTEGVWVHPAAPAPGLSIDFQVSFATGRV